MRVGAVYADPQYRNKAVHRFQLPFTIPPRGYVVLFFVESYNYWELGDFIFFAIGSAKEARAPLKNHYRKHAMAVRPLALLTSTTDEGEHGRLEPGVVRLYEHRLLDGVEPVVPGLGLRLQG